MKALISRIFRQFHNDEEGAAMVEYGLLVALIALVAIGGVTILGTKLSQLFADIGASLTT